MDLPSGECEDVEIVTRVVSGDVDAFEHLVIRYEPLVLRIVKKHVSLNHMEEVAQEVFVRAYRSLSSCREKGKFKSWLSSIAVKTCYDFWRKYYRSKEVPISALGPEHKDWFDAIVIHQSGEVFDRACARNEAREVLDWALAKLGPENKMVIELVHLEGLTAKEASRMLGWSVANVKVRAHRSRKKLKKILKKALAD